VDLDQIGFRRPVPAADPGNHRLKAANLAAIWCAFRAGGAGCLIAVGPLDRPQDVAAYTAALPAAAITLCRLQASREVLDGVGDLWVDTDDRPADEIAVEILGRTGWPVR
jgi:hypothetical protein